MRQVLRAQTVVPAVGLPKVIIQKYEEGPLVVSDWELCFGVLAKFYIKDIHPAYFHADRQQAPVLIECNWIDFPAAAAHNGLEIVAGRNINAFDLAALKALPECAATGREFLI